MSEVEIVQQVVHVTTVAGATVVNAEQVQAISVAAPGPQGVAGPAGADGQPGTPGGSQFLLNQVAPAATWLVAHNLGYFPHITILDSSGEVVLTDIHHADVNSAVLTFASPTTGKAIAS